MSAELDNQYFTWLYEQFFSPEEQLYPHRTHWKLAKQLYEMEFTWVIPNDENRAADGLYLRYLFRLEKDLDKTPMTWYEMPCSMLEMLIAISIRACFMEGGTASDWIWELLENVGVGKRISSDAFYDGQVREAIDAAMRKVMQREYAFNGEGGLFPILDSDQDQRKIELWYQMCEYVIKDM
jgi:hypothetical protein